MRNLRNRPRPAHPGRGVTLIELLVALTLVATLMTVVYAGLNVATLQWQNVGRRAEDFEGARTAMVMLRRQVRAALPLLHGAKPVVGFEGGERHLRFVSNVSWRDGEQAVARWVEWTATDQALSIVERRILPPDNQPEAEGDVLDLTALGGVRLRYLRRAEWRTSWDSTEFRELPAAVEIHYSYRSEPAVMTVPLDYAEANRSGYVLR